MFPSALKKELVYFISRYPNFSPSPLPNMCTASPPKVPARRASFGDSDGIYCYNLEAVANDYTGPSSAYSLSCGLI